MNRRDHSSEASSRVSQCYCPVLHVCVVAKSVYVCLCKVRKPARTSRAKSLWFPIYRSLDLPLEFHMVNSCHFVILSLAVSEVYCSHISDNPGLDLMGQSSRFLSGICGSTLSILSVVEGRKMSWLSRLGKTLDILIISLSAASYQYSCNMSIMLFPSDIFSFFLTKTFYFSKHDSMEWQFTPALHHSQPLKGDMCVHKHIHNILSVRKRPV